MQDVMLRVKSLGVESEDTKDEVGESQPSTLHYPLSTLKSSPQDLR